VRPDVVPRELNLTHGALAVVTGAAVVALIVLALVDRLS
jgi:hypothetical protein